MQKIDFLKDHLKNGYTLVPVLMENDGSVHPQINGWQKRKQITEENVSFYEKINGWGIVTGKLSGNLEVLDFDEKHQLGIFEDWKKRLPPEALKLLATLPISTSKTKGFHVHYRCKQIESNLKLANNKEEDTLIETRGEGGFVFEFPTPNCGYLQHDFSKTKYITPEEREIFLSVAREFDFKKERPGDDFDMKTTWEALLYPLGWKIVNKKGTETYWQRPGKKDKSISATENWNNNGMFHVFTSSTEINSSGRNQGKSYTKFQLYTHLYHADNYHNAAKELAERGFGTSKKSPTSIARVENDELVFLKSSDITSKPIDWLWPGKIAKGKVTLIAGDPGLGKSQATIYLAGVVSNGGIFPGGEKCKKGKVLFFSAEDDPEDTINPRLTAVDSNKENVFIFSCVKKAGKEKFFDLSTDMDLLHKSVEKEKDISLIIVDPVTAFLGDTDSHVNAEVRALLSELSKLASKNNLAVVVVSHFNKSIGGSPLHKITGSLGFVAAARAAYIVIKDDNDDTRRLFLPVKNNLAEDKSGYAFKIEGCNVSDKIDEPILTSRIVWEKEPVLTSAIEIMKEQKHRDASVENSTIKKLESILRRYPDGISTEDYVREARMIGISKRTVYRAEKDMFIDKIGGGKNNTKKWILLFDNEAPNNF